MPYADFMFDAETLGVNLSKKPVLLSIAVVAFDAYNIEKSYQSLQVDFSTKEHISNQVEAGRKIDPDTLNWWKEEKQAAARKIVFSKSTHRTHTDALIEINQFMKDHRADDKMRVWSNGANFDSPMIREYMVDEGIKPCWNFYNECCYRTMKVLRPLSKPKIEGEKHVALTDALTQTRHLQNILVSLGLV